MTDTEGTDDTLPMPEQTLKMVSNNVRCLLSDSSIALQLVAYSDFNNMLPYRLDEEVAVVLVSAVERMDGSGSASLTATVEHMENSKDEKNALERGVPCSPQARPKFKSVARHACLLSINSKLKPESKQ